MHASVDVIGKASSNDNSNHIETTIPWSLNVKGHNLSKIYIELIL
jgi:hypothetical protein